LNQTTPSEAGFKLDPRFAADSLEIADLSLCRVLLMNDSRYPWLILVPKRPEVSEIHHLSKSDQTLLLAEITMVSEVLETEFAPKKINVGALGNIVSQLHVHIVARNEGDPAWPGPVWGHSAAVPYSESEALSKINEISAKLS